MLINCDIGERGANHTMDNTLMEYIHIANIACGVHAGDRESVDFYLKMAKERGIMATAHLSYPDIENFGRVSMEISKQELGQALDKQYALMKDIKAVKFHGALYNDASIDSQMADFLSVWLKKNDIRTVITQDGSELAKYCSFFDIDVLTEAFAERRYTFNSEHNKLVLVPRVMDYASITDCKEAVAHSRKILFKNKVDCYFSGKERNYIEEYPIKAETICIHSDSSIAYELVVSLASLEVV